MTLIFVPKNILYLPTLHWLLCLEVLFISVLFIWITTNFSWIFIVNALSLLIIASIKESSWLLSTLLHTITIITTTKIITTNHHPHKTIKRITHGSPSRIRKPLQSYPKRWWWWKNHAPSWMWCDACVLRWFVLTSLALGPRFGCLHKYKRRRETRENSEREEKRKERREQEKRRNEKKMRTRKRNEEGKDTAVKRSTGNTIRQKCVTGNNFVSMSL